MTTATLPNSDELAQMVEEVYAVNHANGWFTKERSRREDRMLVVSELAEALEAYRLWGMEDRTRDLCAKTLTIPSGHDEAHDNDGHLCKPEGVGSELADVLIRVLDACYRHRHPLRLNKVTYLPSDVESFPDALDYLTDLTYTADTSTFTCMLFRVARSWDIDLMAEYHRKLAYNRTRGFRHGGKRL